MKKLIYSSRSKNIQLKEEYVSEYYYAKQTFYEYPEAGYQIFLKDSNKYVCTASINLESDEYSMILEDDEMQVYYLISDEGYENGRAIITYLTNGTIVPLLGQIFFIQDPQLILNTLDYETLESRIEKLLN